MLRLSTFVNDVLGVLSSAASMARSNLGLGGAAVLNVGTAAGTVAAGNDSRITGAAQNGGTINAQTLQITGNLGGGYTPTSGAVGASGWNYSSGGAEIDHFNLFTGSVLTSFNWYQALSAGGYNLLASLSSTGALTLGGALRIAGSSGPTWSSGPGAPSTTQPNGSLYSRSDGTLGARLYVSTGSAWNAVMSV